jgi:hypothetical protein
MILARENRRTRRKTCPSATLSTTKPTWIDLGANPAFAVRGHTSVYHPETDGGVRQCSVQAISELYQYNALFDQLLPEATACGRRS